MGAYGDTAPYECPKPRKIMDVIAAIENDKNPPKLISLKDYMGSSANKQGLPWPWFGSEKAFLRPASRCAILWIGHQPVMRGQL